MMPTAIAPGNMAGISDKSGSTGRGKPLGMVAMSAIVSTCVQPSTITSTELPISASIIEKLLIRLMRPKPRINPIVMKPMIVVCTLISPRWNSRSIALTTLLLYVL